MKFQETILCVIQKLKDSKRVNALVVNSKRMIKWIFSILPRILKITFLKIVPCLGFLLFAVVPFLHKIIPHTWAYCLWGISAIIYIVDSVVEWVKRRDNNSEENAFEILSRGFSAVIFILFGSVFTINYFDTDYSWKWAFIVTTAIASPILFFNWFGLLKTNNEYSKEEKKAIRWKFIKMVIFYWLADGFFASWILESILFQFLAGGLCMIIIFVNLFEIVLTGKVFNVWFMIHDFVVGVALTVYLIYIIPNDSVQSIVLTITAALYGGLLTLIGVAWTIKDGQERENESKRLGCMPFLQLEIPTKKAAALFELELPLCNTDAVDTVYCNALIKNVGNGTATNITYSWKYAANNISVHDYPPINAIMQGDSYYVQLTCEADEKIEESTAAILILRYSDLLGYEYEQKIVLNFESYDLIRFDNDTPRFIGKVCYQTITKE